MKTPTTTPEIVLFSFFPWEHEYPSTAHGLARALTVYTRVWFVSKPPTWKDAVRQPERVVAKRKALVRDAPGFRGSLKLVDLPPVAPINGLPPGRLYQLASTLVDRTLNRELRGVLAADNVADFVWINLYAPTYFQRLDLHQAPYRRLYYTVDAIGEASYTAKHGVLAEQAQHDQADLSLATSSALARDVRGSSGAALPAEQLAVLPNAMAEALYLDRELLPEPEDLANIPHPRLGYVGNLDGARIDFDVLVQVAKQRPDFHLVLVGPWNAGSDQRARLSSFANIHLLGRKLPEACPAYLQGFDVGLIPFRCTPLTEAIYPLKINEYLAMGLPVVATPFSPDLEAFADVLDQAEAFQWPAVLAKAVAATAPADREARIHRARANTWAARAQTLWQRLGVKKHHASTPQAC